MVSLLSLPAELRGEILENIIPVNQTFEFLLCKNKGHALRADRGYGICGFPAFNTSVFRIHPVITSQCNDLLYGKNCFQLQIGIDIHHPTDPSVRDPPAQKRARQPEILFTDEFLRKIRRCRILLVIERFFLRPLRVDGPSGMAYICQIRDVIHHIVKVLRKGAPLRSLAFQLLWCTRSQGSKTTRAMFESEIDIIFQHVLDPFVELRAYSLSFGQSRLEEEYKTYLRGKILEGEYSPETNDAFQKAFSKYDAQPRNDCRNFWSSYPSAWDPQSVLLRDPSSWGQTPCELAFFTTLKVGPHTMNIALYDRDLDEEWLVDQAENKYGSVLDEPICSFLGYSS